MILCVCGVFRRGPGDCGTASEGYEPFEDSIGARVRARHQSADFSPGGTASDAYEPLAQSEASIGARVRTRHELTRASDGMIQLCTDDEICMV